MTIEHQNTGHQNTGNPPSGPPRHPRPKTSKLRLWGRRILTSGFLLLVAWLLFTHARKTDWEAVRTAITGYDLAQVLIACVLAAGSYLAYASYDLFGRHYVRHGISVPRTMSIAFICCAFTLNLGALIGSIGFRYKLYSQRGVRKGDVAHIVGMSITTNWLGYGLVAGLVFLSGSFTFPEGWGISNALMNLLGAALVAVVVGYWLLCIFAQKRSWNIRGQVITLPTIRIALLQIAASAAHWLCMGGVIFIFLYGQVGYFSLLGVLLLSSIAGLIAHVPGALGVLEAVFLALLADTVAPAQLLAALIAYRAVFYLLPLLVAIIAYVLNEISSKRMPSDRQK